MVYAVMFPDREILWGFLIPIKVKYFVMIVGAMAFLSSFQVNTGVSKFAHLGGLLFGYLFLKTPNLQFDPVAPIRGSIGTGSCSAPRRSFRCTCGSRAPAAARKSIDSLTVAVR